MGKKSKRTRNSNPKKHEPKDETSDHQDAEIITSLPKRTTTISSKLQSKQESNKTTLEESLDNLHFEDPFEDEFEEEIVETHDEVDEDMKEEDEKDKDSKEKYGIHPKASKSTTCMEDESNEEKIQSWTPFSDKHKLSPNERLEIDETAYTMHHALTPEWPSLSFSILRDDLGDSRTRFPHSLICAVGTQADKTDKNRLTIMKMSDLAKTSKSREEEDFDEMAKAYDEEDDDDDDDDYKENEDNENDMDPILEHFSMKHHGGVNRVRAMPQMPNIVATWSDVGNVYMYNVQSILDTFERSSGNMTATSTSTTATTTGMGSMSAQRTPFFTYQGHSTEGYAMDWSPVTTGQFATGDCHGSIHLWSPETQLLNPTQTPSTSSFHITSNAYTSSKRHSVEDIQWSPTESTVLAAAYCHGELNIYDTRRHKQAMLRHNVTNHTGVDLNVIAWNHNVSNLLATGADDGVFSVWDLRTFTSSQNKKIEPLARFTCHRTPITSLEWHPTDESMILVSDDDAVYVYDLSIETDDIPMNGGGGTNEKNEEDAIPPQLLFLHAGSNLVKESHWHPQIPSLIMSTAFTGFSVFVPSNL